MSEYKHTSDDGEVMIYPNGKPNTSPWISVDERLPDITDEYLVWFEESEEYEAHAGVVFYDNDYADGGWDCGAARRVSHWKPVRPPGREGE